MSRPFERIQRRKGVDVICPSPTAWGGGGSRRVMQAKDTQTRNYTGPLFFAGTSGFKCQPAWNVPTKQSVHTRDGRDGLHLKWNLHHVLDCLKPPGAEIKTKKKKVCKRKWNEWIQMTRPALVATKGPPPHPHQGKHQQL